MPVDVLLSMLVGLARQETLTAHIGMMLTERNHELEKPEEVSVFLNQLPIEPADFVILTIGVVISLLGVPDFITSQEHGYSLREQENSHKIFDLALSQCFYVWITRLSFQTMVATVILIGTIAVVFPVGLIVFGMVGYQVIEREAVMTRDEIDTVDRHMPCCLVEI